MLSLQPYFQNLLKSLPAPPTSHNDLQNLVKQTLEEAKAYASSDNWKNQWEYLLREEIFRLAATEGAALNANEVAYYDELRDKLDVILLFTEQDACEQTFPFFVLQDLLETQTIASCSHIFSWIEDRAARLTEGMVPQKGKALILLRTLNELLRRLSKMGSTTIFCGRILTFLSGVFPLGERSGVNLRGEYGPSWEGVNFAEGSKDRPATDDKDVVMTSDSSESKEDQMQVDTKDAKSTAVEKTPSEKREEFYNTFWALQLYFSKPTEFMNKGALEDFTESVSKVIPVIKEATAKERAMMGSRNLGTNASLKRKRESEPEESNVTEYFFAKFLTSPELLDLEIADTHFRRQFLFQLLILLHHLLTFTKEAKESWTTPRNRSLQMDFTLEAEDAQWVQDAISKVTEELRQTTPNGRQFSETVTTILERERNWIKWKNEICVPFDKEPWVEVVDEKPVGLFDATRGVREKMQSPPEPWKWELGTEPLTEIWALGYRDLSDLQTPFHPGDLKNFMQRIKQDDARIAMRRRQLDAAQQRLAQARAARAAAAAVESEPPKQETLATPTPVAATASASPLHPSLPPKPGSPVKPSVSQDSVPPSSSTPVVSTIISTTPSISTPAPPAPITTYSDEQINKLEEHKSLVTWLGLRIARERYLQHFSKAGTGNLEMLIADIEGEKQREKQGEKQGEKRGAKAETGDEAVEGAGEPSQQVEMET